MATQREMRISKSGAEAVILFVFSVISISATAVAIVNIFNFVGIIASLAWLAFIAFILWSGCKQAGGARQYLINHLGTLFGKYFVTASEPDSSGKIICFGFYLLGKRFIQKNIAVDKIESIYWSTGQATGMAGRDMNDWSVYLWFDHCDPVKSEKKRKLRKPDQDIYVVGPARRKEITEKLGLVFIAFIRASGAQLVQGEKSNSFVRCKN